MRDWDVRRVAAAAGATIFDGGAGPSAGPTGVSIDSRAVRPGDLFVGLTGEHADGGTFAAAALAAGAWGVLVSPEHAAPSGHAEATGHADPSGHPEPSGHAEATGHADPSRRTDPSGHADLSGAADPTGHADPSGDVEGSEEVEPAGPTRGVGPAGVTLVVEDPLAGLQALARAWRRELGAGGARVVGITGSTGKTSTKDILAGLLGPAVATVSSPRNHNTEIGLPLAVLAAPAGTEALVLELAMRGPGQIGLLASICEPDVGVIVNVGPAHLELLGSIEAIAAAKAELLAALEPGATAVIPVDEPSLDPFLRDDLDVVRFGRGGHVSLVSAEADAVVIDLRGEPISVEPGFRSPHQLTNLLAAAAAAAALGVRPHGRIEVAFSGGRGDRRLLASGVVLVDDCYNANPMSMRAALEELKLTASGRRVAVLGDMLELGPDERRYHAELGDQARGAGVELLVTVGPRAAWAGERFGAGHRQAADADQAARIVPGLLRAGDTVLIKGSRGVGLEAVTRALAAV